MMLSANYFAVALVALLASSTNALQETVDLGTADGFAILSKSGVSTTGVTSVKGDMGVSPIAATAITGFTLIMDSSGQFSTTTLVDGQVYAPTYTSPTPDKMTTVVSNMETAYTDAAGRSNPDTTELGAGNVEGMTLVPGLHKWGTSVGFTSSLTFAGTSTDIWILQIDKDLIVGNGARINLLGGASAANIFFQVAEKAVIGTTAHVEGILLVKTGITFNNGSSLNGAALSQTAVTLDATTIVNF